MRLQSSPFFASLVSPCLPLSPLVSCILAPELFPRILPRFRDLGLFGAARRVPLRVIGTREFLGVARTLCAELIDDGADASGQGRRQLGEFFQGAALD